MIKILKYGEVPLCEILSRAATPSDIADTVFQIIENVREKKDAALFEYT